VPAKSVILRSALLWLAVTVSLSIVIVFMRGRLDLVRAQDDYMAYWDYRLVFFLIPWIGLSLPVWMIGTWLMSRKSSK
jgi:uncharacterized membrane protein